MRPSRGPQVRRRPLNTGLDGRVPPSLGGGARARLDIGLDGRAPPSLGGGARARRWGVGGGRGARSRRRPSGSRGNLHGRRTWWQGLALPRRLVSANHLDRSRHPRVPSNLVRGSHASPLAKIAERALLFADGDPCVVAQRQRCCAEPEDPGRHEDGSRVPFHFYHAPFDLLDSVPPTDSRRREVTREIECPERNPENEGDRGGHRHDRDDSQNAPVRDARARGPVHSAPSMAVIASSTGWRPANEALGCCRAVLTEFLTQSPFSRPSVPVEGACPS